MRLRWQEPRGSRGSCVLLCRRAPMRIPTWRKTRNENNYIRNKTYFSVKLQNKSRFPRCAPVAIGPPPRGERLVVGNPRIGSAIARSQVPIRLCAKKLASLRVRGAIGKVDLRYLRRVPKIARGSISRNPTERHGKVKW